MDTILVLTDFSKASEDAASYACVLAAQLKSSTIVLYHSYTAAFPVSEAGVIATDMESIRRLSLENLKDLEAKIKNKIPPGVVIRHRTDMEGLTEINSVATEERAQLIVMGTVSKTKLEEIFLGSTALAVCKSSDFPVVLVPVQVDIQPVKQIVFACDMKEVEETVPLDPLKMILDDFKVPLTVLNVDDEDKHFTPDTPLNTIELHDMLDDYHPAYYNINNDNVVKGIIEFAARYPGTLALLISKRHNFMEGLFYRSITRKLAYATSFPLLILREKEHEMAHA